MEKRGVMRKSKTFQEGDDVGLPMMFVNDLVWNYAGSSNFIDPAEEEFRLRNKVKITVEVYEEDN